MPIQNIRIAVRTSGSVNPPPPTIIAQLEVYGANQNHINNILTITPTLTLSEYSVAPGGGTQIISSVNIPVISSWEYISGVAGVFSPPVIFRTRFNQSDLLDNLTDGAFYLLNTTSNYIPGYTTQLPYYLGEYVPQWLKWIASTGQFETWWSSPTGLVTDPNSPNRDQYRIFDPLTTNYIVRGGLPKGGGGGREE
jgi:hypothetical protein